MPVTDLIKSVASLENLGLDMSYMRDLRVEFGLEQPEPTKPTTTEMLEQNSMRLLDLATIQNARLNQPPAMTITDAIAPSAIESQLANRTMSELGKIVGDVPPGEMIETSALRVAMGVADPDVDLDLFSEFFSVPQ
jgi:hypothetical protein